MKKRQEHNADSVLRNAHFQWLHIYFFTQFLDDNKQNERELGLFFGLALLTMCDEMWALVMQLRKVWQCKFLKQSIL